MISDIVYAGRQFENKTDLWAAIKNAAEEICENRKDQTRNPYADMPRRLVEVIEAKGASIER